MLHAKGPVRAQNERQRHPGKLYEGPLAQLVEHRTFNPWVVGSSPTGPTAFFSSFIALCGMKSRRHQLASRHTRNRL